MYINTVCSRRAICTTPHGCFYLTGSALGSGGGEQDVCALLGCCLLLSAGSARCSELALCMCPDPGFWLPAVQELSHCGLRGKGEGQQKAYTVKQAQKLRTVLPSSLIFWTIHSSLSSSFVLLQGCTGMVKLSISLM